jgi:hypothetical protein
VPSEDHPDTLVSIKPSRRDPPDLGDLHDARELFELALAGYRLVLADNHPDTINAMNSLTEVHSELGSCSH